MKLCVAITSDMDLIHLNRFHFTVSSFSGFIFFSIPFYIDTKMPRPNQFSTENCRFKKISPIQLALNGKRMKNIFKVMLR